MRRAMAIVTAGAAVLAAGALLRGQDATSEHAIVRLAVEGRSNATPSIAARGAFVAVAWSATAAGAGDVMLAVSRDGGQRFTDPIIVNDQRGEARNGGEMPPRVALVSGADPAADPDIVVVWRARTPVTSIRQARSRDGGRTFAPAVTLQSADAAGERGWQTATVDADGRVHAVWLDHRGLASAARGGATAHAHHRQATAAPAGSSAAAAATNAAALDGAAMAQRSGFYYATVADASGPERELAKGVCYCCKTALAAGPGGALYAAWRHVYAGNIRDIAFIASRDGGRTFDAPVRVSEDRWQLAGCPDDGPAMAVDRAGVVHVVWPTVIGGDLSASSGGPEGALFHASTRDGRTFTPRVRIPTPASPKPSHPQLAIAEDGRLVVAWDETVGGVRRAVMAVGAAGGVPSFPAPVALDAAPFEAPRAAVYPSLAVSATHALAAWTSGSGETAAIAVRRFPLAAAGSR
jgi:hypothetical protein